MKNLQSNLHVPAPYFCRRGEKKIRLPHLRKLEKNFDSGTPGKDLQSPSSYGVGT